MKLADLRQGFFFSKGTASQLLEKSVDLAPIPVTDDFSLVVISQDCDLVRDTSAEPYVEFILGNPIQTELDGNRINGKNPRFLQFQNDSIRLEFSIHDRFRVKKEGIESLLADTDICRLGSDNIDILKKWISKRYTRAAFPDEFNRRLSSNKIYKKLEKKDISKNVSYVLISVPDEEYGEGEIYEPDIIVVIPTDIDNKTKAEIRDLYEDGFSIEGEINPDIRLLLENDIPISLLRLYKRWDKDSCSMGDENKPAEGADSI